MSLNQLLLISSKLPFNYFLHQVNRNIHIIRYLFRSDDGSPHRDGHLDLLAIFLDTHRDDYLRVLCKVALQLSEFFHDGPSHGFCHINIFSADCKSHKHSLLWRIFLQLLYYSERV